MLKNGYFKSRNNEEKKTVGGEQCLGKFLQTIYSFFGNFYFVYQTRLILQQNNRKYFRRGELIAKDQEVKEVQENNDEDVKINTTQQQEDSVTDGSSEHLTLPRHEVIRRLRERSEPILLFGESEIEAFKRLRKCEILEPEVNKVSIKNT